MKIENIRVEDLHPYERNPRKNDAAVGPVAESIRQFGFKVPIIIDKNNEIIAGHTRLKAAELLGLETVPCIRADDLTDEQVKAFRLADNKVAEFAEWDPELLDWELADLKLDDVDMTVFGFEREPETVDDVREDNYLEAPPEEAITQEGDLYILGEHRLLCGDSTSEDDIRVLMDGKKPVFVFTDPPYGVAIGDKNESLRPFRKVGITENIQNDDISQEALYKILVKAFTNLREAADPGCSYYVSAPQGGDLGLMMLQMMTDAGLKVRHNLIWVKNHAAFSLGRLDYDYRHEPIFYTWTDHHNFYGGYSTTVIDDTKPVDKMNKEELKDLVRALSEGKEQSVIYCDRPVKSKLHPTMKPVKLVARFMVNSSQPGDICADIFGGSGTTMIAAEQLGRRCFMMEKDPHYCDVIVQRWEAFTGKKAERVNTKEH